MREQPSSQALPNLARVPSDAQVDATTWQQQVIASHLAPKGAGKTYSAVNLAMKLEELRNRQAVLTMTLPN